MFNKSISAASFTAALALLLLLPSCGKKEQGVEDNVGLHIALAEKTFNDVQSIADQAALTGALPTFSTGAQNCATISHDTGADTRILTIDFGQSECLCSDGIYRKGRIIVEYSGPYMQAGNMHTITFMNYFADRNEVRGTKKVQLAGYKAQDQPYYNITDEGSLVLGNGGGTVKWLSGRTRTWKAGFATAVPEDDAFELTGSAVLITNGGVSYNSEITTPLMSGLSCRWIKSGVIQISPEGSTTPRTLNYGSGACDALATYSYEGNTYTINLR